MTYLVEISRTDGETDCFVCSDLESARSVLDHETDRDCCFGAMIYQNDGETIRPVR